ncbi:hypothetical protein TrST_g14038 [Triparma strigata]|uniref:EGF-like domain-containing protein n=1 Tax=Triparma strigata TaxID=1606541 RepID=A0A9W7ADZ7_9STRA|nr:hypothetical protein TrST_g14038 [Triparma strigata]
MVGSRYSVLSLVSLLLLNLWATAQLAASATASSTTECTQLKTTLNYSQSNSPRDISQVLRVVVEKVNRELEGVIDVDVEWTGSELHRKVGQYTIKSSVTRRTTSPSGLEITAKECFEVPFVIEDTDECSLPVGHVMAHKCHESAACVNTNGGYECKCEGEGLWGKSLMEGTARGKPSTEGECEEGDEECRGGFVCPVDPCGVNGDSDCDVAKGAKCASEVFKDGTGVKYTCQCPSKTLGNGHVCTASDDVPSPKVGFDGKPTEATITADYCSCTTPSVDQCAGFPACAAKNTACKTQKDGSSPSCECKTGYVETKEHGCVDETPPKLKLRCDPDGDGVTRLRQGDNYEECAVDIEDDNAEDLARTLKITYSDPLPSGCLRKMGEFHVNYTVASPWTEPPFQRVTRTVRVGDLDECKISAQEESHFCLEALPRCDISAGAICKNTPGSYTCECPKCTEGDGFLPISGLKLNDPSSPVNYSGGTGCTDNCKPTITLKGPNPKVFRACKCGGLLGMTKHARGIERNEGEAGNFDADVKTLIKASSGAELCATKENKDVVEPGMCAAAVDHTPDGVVDLTAQIQVGDPVKHPTKKNSWRVPYNVVDKAGNRAQTVWRDVRVDELTFDELEAVMREEFEVEKKKAVEEAVAAASRKERQDCEGQKRELRVDLENAADDGPQNKRGKRARGASSCPKCETCPPPPTCGEDDGKSTTKLSNELRTCKTDLANAKRRGAAAVSDSDADERSNILASLEDLFPLFLLLIVGCSAVGLLIMIMQRAKSVLGGGGGDGKTGKASNDERAAALAKSVYYHSPRHGAQPIGSPNGNGNGGGVRTRSSQQSPLFGGLSSSGAGGGQAGSQGGAQGGGVSGVFSPASVGSVQSPAYSLSPITPRSSRR